MLALACLSEQELTPTAPRSFGSTYRQHTGRVASLRLRRVVGTVLRTTAKYVVYGGPRGASRALEGVHQRSTELTLKKTFLAEELVFLASATLFLRHNSNVFECQHTVLTSLDELVPLWLTSYFGAQVANVAKDVVGLSSEKHLWLGTSGLTQRHVPAPHAGRSE